MLGVLVNVITVTVGACLGLLFRRAIPEKVNQAAMVALGACTLVIGLSGCLTTKSIPILLASSVLGGILGTLLRLEDRIDRLGKRCEAHFRQKEGQGEIAKGLVSATLLFCVGSMTVTGSLQSGLTGDHSILYTKAALDLVSSTLLASTLGVGVLFSAAAVLIIQGGLVLLAGLLAPVLSPEAVCEMTAAGSLVILLLGTNLMGLSRFKVADFLPAIFLAPLFSALAMHLGAL